jgi:dienelactone hydrolase
MPERVPLELEVRETVDCGTYRRESIVFDSEATMAVPAFLLVPHDRAQPGAAVLAQHGHGPGKTEVCGMGEEKSAAAIAAQNGDYAHQLAERGYVVLAPDLRCFGERADWNPPDKYGCDLDLVHAVAAGANPLRRICGISAARSTCSSNTPSSTRIASAWSASRMAAPRPSSWPHGTTGCAPPS